LADRPGKLDTTRGSVNGPQLTKPDAVANGHPTPAARSAAGSGEICGSGDPARFDPFKHIASTWLYIKAIFMAMKSAKISELKNRLSYYLRYVRRGQSVLVYDRDRPIARIDPVRETVASEGADWTSELERTGALRPPGAPLPPGWLGRRQRVASDVVSALIAEREGAR
jgi:prevent-host-death family protein